MELEDGIHKSRPKGQLFETDAESESIPEQPRGKRPHWRLPLMIVLSVVVVLGGGVLGYLHFQHNTSTGQQAIQYKWCTSTGAPLTGQPGDANSSLSGLQVIAPDNIWAIGDASQSDSGNGTAQDTPFFEHWDGAHWSVVPGADTSALLNDLTNKLPPGAVDESTYINQLAVLSADNIWAVGSVALYQISTGESVGYTLIEHWDGQQWKIVPSSDELAQGNNYFNSVAAISANDIWAVGSTSPASPSGAQGNLNAPLFEHWDGTRWSTMQVPASFQPDTFDALSAISANDIWVAGSGPALGDVQNPVPLVAHWDGQQWSQIALPNSLGFGALNDVIALSARDIWAIGRNFSSMGASSGSSPILIHWDGQSWSSVANTRGLVSGSYLSGFAVNGANDIWAAGFTGDPASSTSPILEHWDGKQWNNLNLSSLHVVHSGSLNDVTISGKKIWLAGEQYNSTRNMMVLLIATSC